MEDTRIHCEMFAKEGDHKADESLVVVTGLSLEGAAWTGKGDGKLANLPPKTYFSEFPKVVVMAHPKPAGAPAELLQWLAPISGPREGERLKVAVHRCSS